jgi:hypothetical protein
LFPILPTRSLTLCFPGHPVVFPALLSIYPACSAALLQSGCVYPANEWFMHGVFVDTVIISPRCFHGVQSIIFSPVRPLSEASDSTSPSLLMRFGFSAAVNSAQLAFSTCIVFELPVLSSVSCSGTMVPHVSFASTHSDTATTFISASVSFTPALITRICLLGIESVGTYSSLR